METLTKEVNLADLQSHDPKIKYGCARDLLAIAKANPVELYPRFDYFVKLLDTENNILKWTAIDIIGLLSKVDEEKKIDELLGRLYGLLNAGKLITAAHAITALTEIALNKPEYQDEITTELLRIEHYDYDTIECRNIALGKAVLAIGSYFDGVKDQKAVCAFIQRQVNNTRNATRKKAEQLFRKISSR